MPRPAVPVRSRVRARAAAAIPLLVLVAACSTGGAAPRASAGEDPPGPAGAGWVTVVERRVGDASMVTRVVRGDAGMSATMAVVEGTGAETLVFEEVRIGTDHWVHAAAAEGAVAHRAAWIHFDLSRPAHRRFLDEHPVGLFDEADLFDAEEGEAVGEDVVTDVEHVSATERLVRFGSGVDVHVRRRMRSPAPVVAPPDSLPVVPFEDIESLVVRPG